MVSSLEFSNGRNEERNELDRLEIRGTDDTGCEMRLLIQRKQYYHTLI